MRMPTVTTAKTYQIIGNKQTEQPLLILSHPMACSNSGGDRMLLEGDYLHVEAFVLPSKMSNWQFQKLDFKSKSFLLPAHLRHDIPINPTSLGIGPVNI